MQAVAKAIPAPNLHVNTENFCPPPPQLKTLAVSFVFGSFTQESLNNYPSFKRKHPSPTYIKAWNLLPSWCPVWPTCSDKEGLGGPGEEAGRCEKQVFGSVNVCNQVIWPARENKHNLINTNTSNTHKGTYAELIFEGEIKAIFVCVPSCLKHSEPRLQDADCALQKMSILSCSVEAYQPQWCAIEMI